MPVTELVQKSDATPNIVYICMMYVIYKFNHQDLNIQTGKVQFLENWSNFVSNVWFLFCLKTAVDHLFCCPLKLKKREENKST